MIYLDRRNVYLDRRNAMIPLDNSVSPFHVLLAEYRAGAEGRLKYESTERTKL